MIRKKKSIEFEQKCNEIEMKIQESLLSVKDYSYVHLEFVYQKLLRSILNEKIKVMFY